ncbi:kanadaptin [Pangasianodon hypophthalmus]|uniref:kanadaptin n=1 Tax=Pangasianodon hypophthalmus TaxID=310915 RepID=UPI002306FA12|nr:kanadaptin [Pangasianodon hypophthalmus]
MADTARAASESDGCLNSENKSEMEAPKSSGDDKEESTNLSQDPFKKPAIFAAPSVALKKSKSVQKIASESDSAVITKDQPKPEASDEKEPSKESAGNDDQSFKHDPESLNQAPVPEKPLTKEKQVNATAKPEIKSKKPAKVPPSGKFPPLPYTEPPWAGVPGVPYTFELLKNGAILDAVPLTQQSYFVVGRLPVCDISLEHPSISRYHAVVQYRGKAGDPGAVGEELGFYIYDLGSTHGTFVNKNKIPPKTYIRLHVGHVLKFGGSTRLFILQGPESDEEAESELTVTELKEQARKQREDLEKRMMGDGSDNDDDDDDDKEEKNGEKVAGGRSAAEDSGCSWGMGEDAAPEEEENEENPFATEFQEDQEAAYLKDPKKALQGFYDREGEELEFEYDDKGHGTWLCRIKLPVDDAMGRQLVAEVTHSGRKKEAAVQCCLEACRMLEARGLLRQEAVSRKRKKKNWEEDDYYDSDDDSFLDRTGTVERKRKERMKKAGKIQEKPETYNSLVAKLAEVEKELATTENTLKSSEKGDSSSATEDPLDAFMSSVRSQAAVDVVQRKKLHLHVAELKKEEQRLRKLIELTRPTQLPSLQSRPGTQSSESDKPKKLALPLFGAMKGGSKFKLKTGTIGKLPPKRPNLPPQLFNMKELPPGGEEEEEEDEQEEGAEKPYEMDKECKDEEKESTAAIEADMEPAQADETEHVEASSASKHAEETCSRSPKEKSQNSERQPVKRPSSHGKEKATSVHPKDDSSSAPQGEDQPPLKKSGKMIGPSRPPSTLSKQYPEDDPDYCVWVPPAGQTGDGRTHLNDKYGY